MLAWGAGDASAQVQTPCSVPVNPLFHSLPAQISCPFVANHQEPDESLTLSPGRAFLYSALLPGVAQRKLGKGHWIAYLAVEAAAWIGFGHAHWSATDQRGQYQDLAWEVARSFSGPRIDGDFSYYETLEKFLDSGIFDTDPSASGIQPEMDASTFNGSVWLLATEVHFPFGSSPGPGDPEYAAALLDYERRAYDDRFAWSWAGQPAAWDDYMDLIDSSDGSFRRASQFMGLIVANHLLSGIDAFLTARVQASGGARTQAQIRLVPRDDRRGIGLVLQIRH